jgi:Tol biopolymer transport system component
MFGLLLAAGGYFWFTKQGVSKLPQFKERQLTTNSSENSVQTARISPDGKYLAYSDLKGVHLKLIQTGETRLMAEPQSVNGITLAWYVNAWFPDGLRFLASKYQLGIPGGIWIISVMGGSPRKLSVAAFVWSVSPDGSSVAFAAKDARFGAGNIWIMRATARKLVDWMGRASIRA